MKEASSHLRLAFEESDEVDDVPVAQSAQEGGLAKGLLPVPFLPSGNNL
jgi:hypothetical protein